MRDGNTMNRSYRATVAFTRREYAQLGELLAVARESDNWTGPVTISEVIRYAIRDLHCAVLGGAVESPTTESDNGTQANAG